MGIKQKDLNPLSVGVNTKDVVPQPLYWDKKKKEILDMIVKEDTTINEISEKVNLTPWKVSKYIRDKEFQRRYTAIVEANTQQLVGENNRLIQELMRRLRRELKYKIQKLDPDKLLKEYRLLLQGVAQPVKQELIKGPKFQQNIINPQALSPKALKLLEDAVLKEQGFKPLETTNKEIIEIQDGEE